MNNNKHIKLEEIHKENPFRVPDKYFGELPDRIMARCEEEEATHVKENSLIRILKPAFSLAAMFIGVAFLAFMAVQVIHTTDKNSTPILDEMAKADYEKTYRSEEEIIKAIQEKQNMQQNANQKEAEEYIDYLLNEDIDYGTLIDELQKKDSINK